MNQEKRIGWVDFVKFICIIMVMLSHLETRTDILNVFYTPFFLTAFFFTAGYVYRPKENFKDFMYLKIRQLFVPWLVFSIFNIVLSQVVSFNEHESLLEELKWNFFQIRGQGDQIWFLAALFVAFIPFYFFIKKYEVLLEESHQGKYRGLGLVAIMVAWLLSLISILYTRFVPTDIFAWNSTSLPWHIEYMFQAMFYMVLGYVFKYEFEEKIDEHNTVTLRIIAVVVYCIVVFVPFFAKLKLSIIGDILYQYIASLLGIFALIINAKVVRNNRYINYVGQNTLIFFAIHGKVYSVIQVLLKSLAEEFYRMVLNSILASSIFCVVLSVILSVILIIPAYIINKWFPFIIGRNNKKQ